MDTLPDTSRCLGYSTCPGDRVRCSRGDATVLGVHGRRLWYHVDSEEGAWFWTVEQEITDIGSGELYVTQSAQEIEQDPQLETFKQLNEKGIHPNISFSDFVNLLTGHDQVKQWTAAADAELIDMLSKTCETRGCHPSNIPFWCLAEYHTRIQQSNSALHGISLCQLQARATLLLLLNEALEVSLFYKINLDVQKVVEGRIASYLLLFFFFFSSLFFSPLSSCMIRESIYVISKHVHSIPLVSLFSCNAIRRV